MNEAARSAVDPKSAAPRKPRAGLVLTAWSGLDYFFRFVVEIFKR